MDGPTPAPAAASPVPCRRSARQQTKLSSKAGTKELPRRGSWKRLLRNQAPRRRLTVKWMGRHLPLPQHRRYPAAVSTITDKVDQQSGHEGMTTPSILETSAPQSSTSPQTGAKMDGLAPAPAVASPGTPPAVTTVKASQRIAVPTDAPADWSVPTQTLWRLTMQIALPETVSRPRTLGWPVF